MTDRSVEDVCKEIRAGLAVVNSDLQTCHNITSRIELAVDQMPSKAHWIAAAIFIVLAFAAVTILS